MSLLLLPSSAENKPKSTTCWHTSMTFLRHPVYVRRVNPSAFGFSLSSHRWSTDTHVYVFHLAFALLINNKPFPSLGPRLFFVLLKINTHTPVLVHTQPTLPMSTLFILTCTQVLWFFPQINPHRSRVWFCATIWVFCIIDFLQSWSRLSFVYKSPYPYYPNLFGRSTSITTKGFAPILSRTLPHWSWWLNLTRWEPHDLFYLYKSTNRLRSQGFTHWECCSSSSGGSAGGRTTPQLGPGDKLTQTHVQIDIGEFWVCDVWVCDLESRNYRYTVDIQVKP